MTAFLSHDGVISQRIQCELEIRAKLEHDNILPLYGYTRGFGILVAIVNPWAENGNLTAFLECEKEDLTAVRRFEIVSFPWGYM